MPHCPSLPSAVRRGTLVAAVLAAALLAGACGGPPPPPPPPGSPAGYEALRETFGPRDFGPLAGRRVVLDPGHGGFFRGALGPEGLAEADVNLGVALNLRGLLEWAGATVFMTRTADYDFLAGTDSSLTTDLAFRVAFADSLQPDVFLSIHHNSNPTRDPTINETQTYHPLGADGASLDLARSIHRHLVVNLEISPARILPGNFHVLRHATVPAVLGEPAMLSNPVVEGRLTLAASQRLEAEAYFLGLLDYFSGGDPAWLPAQPDTVIVGPGGAQLAWTFLPAARDTVAAAAAPGPDPTTFRLDVDGRPAHLTLDADGRRISWRAPAPNGAPVGIALLGRNLRGRATPVARTVLMPAAGLVLDVVAVRGGDEGCPDAGLTWSVPGGAPAPVGVLRWPDGSELAVGPDAPREALLPCTAADQAPVFVTTHGDSAPVAIRWRTDRLPAGWSWRRLTGTAPRTPWTARPLPGAPSPPRPLGRHLLPVHETAPRWWTAPGFGPLVDADPLDPLAPRTTHTSPEPWAPAPLAPGLAGRLVVIDPAGGGADDDGTGPAGLSGAAVNLGVARQLANLLEGLGAHAVLTRSGAEAPTAIQRVGMAQTADLFLSVGRAAVADTAFVGHHPGSRVGEPWAAHTAAAVAGLLGGTAGVVVEPSWAYLLRHTACPALEVRLPHATTVAAGMRLESPAWQAAEARALLFGVLAVLDPAAAARRVDPAEVLAGLASAPDPAAVDWALWAGSLPWYPLPRAGLEGDRPLESWGEPGLPAGPVPHTLEIHNGPHWQLWLLDGPEAAAPGRLVFAADRDTD